MGTLQNCIYLSMIVFCCENTLFLRRAFLLLFLLRSKVRRRGEGFTRRASSLKK